ncbi:equilibrative nucleotide transporter 3-like isoform X2 [Camellia sinensis]|nr:equilibrative nucleotide transporter 3-like isoform X2 [Camellia sinensis]XP_028109309.1 equilibrative nucleotide transporter 3-like isoform X2 [Camellia sinensis]XP_028109310.1 equilibrative nucleotide transporter 3-like isoform X2 [Camellia sinensis]
MEILAYNESKIDTRQRNLTGYILFFISTFALLVLDLATSGKGGIGNFISICIIVAACRVADAHVQGGMVGDLSFMCPEFIQMDAVVHETKLYKTNWHYKHFGKNYIILDRCVWKRFG